jgi:hypothetical protein
MGSKAPLFLALLLFLAGWGAAQARTDASRDKDLVCLTAQLTRSQVGFSDAVLLDLHLTTADSYAAKLDSTT